MPDEPPVGLEEPLLATRQGPSLHGGGKDEPAQQIAEVLRDDIQSQPDLAGPQAMTKEALVVAIKLLLGPVKGACGLNASGGSPQRRSESSRGSYQGTAPSG